MEQNDYKRKYIDNEEAFQLWREKWTSAEIAHHFGVKRQSVVNWLCRHGLEDNVKAESEKQRTRYYDKLTVLSIECKLAGMQYGEFTRLTRAQQEKAIAKNQRDKNSVEPFCAVCKYEKCDPSDEPCVSCCKCAAKNKYCNFEVAYKC